LIAKKILMLKLREKNDEIESKKNEKKGLNQKKKR